MSLVPRMLPSKRLSYELAASGNNFLAPSSSAMSLTPIAVLLLHKGCRLCSLEVNAKAPEPPGTHQPGAEQVSGLLMAIPLSPGMMTDDVSLTDRDSVVILVA